ncbi:MAG: sulfurtransferase [Arenicellales bacterium]|jgi:thiosulfate/3-mercaptopyruvate sulfurtransferase|nr:sulfurtransferase [Arenicellales bacterium]MDP6551383.1 sulfurtransferase [Arenicellales bacterium]MDP6791877.1 sulfurtransferase [Arenicellales bacterium]MDP6947732.1 sulfurtransferase [Arenicellales bacterium]|tara:strand:+ start:17197 stop:18027 length:831 start_codon:yes stop_codon:yes gene_type:complete
MAFSSFLVEPEELEALLTEPAVLVVDLGKPQTYAQLHVPGAMHLEYSLLTAGTQPVPGLLPPEERLTHLAGMLRLNEVSRIIAYDDEGGGWAARLAWTLHYLGYDSIQVLNGGIHAWNNEGHPVNDEPVFPDTSANLPLASRNPNVLADRAYILEHLGDEAIVLLDARTPEEYSGTKVRAARGGHIPGAANLNWLETMDRNRNLRLKPAESLIETLEALGVRPEQEVITYCQSHHRSAHAWLMLKSLGFPRVRGYAGSWSEWGNAPDVPIATGTPA